MIDTLVVATGNQGKLKEISELLADLDVSVVSAAQFPAAPDVDEPHDTFCANAVRKAKKTAVAINEWTLADDSGLEIAALDGRPGVHSSRVANTDPQRIEWLLDAMADVPCGHRQGRFVCCIALSSPDGKTQTWRETVEGRIAENPRGSAGFGYDPVFFYPPEQKTFGQMTPQEKSRVSHRGKALMAFRHDFLRIQKGDRQLSSSTRNCE